MSDLLSITGAIGSADLGPASQLDESKYSARYGLEPHPSQ
jgi:hypothetical protein